MENQDKDKVIQQMSMFNFDTPIKVSVILEETETDELNTLLDKMINHTVPSPSKIKLNTLKTQLQNESTKSFSDVCVDAVDNHILKTNYEKHFRIGQNSSDINVENNYLPTYKNINSYSTPRREKTTQNETSNNSQNVETPINIPLEIRNRNIINLLDSVSCNFIRISKFYHKIVPYISKGNRYSQEIAMQKYLEYKYYCYNCSYQIVNLLILPVATNQAFIESFIERTIELAFKRSWYRITKEFLIDIFKGMISWSKQHKIYLECKTRNQNLTQSSTYNTIKKTHTNRPNNEMSKGHLTDNVDSICIFACGPENRKLTISIAPEILNDHINSKKAVDAYKQNPQTHTSRKNILTDDARYAKIDEYYDFHKKRSRTEDLSSISTRSEKQTNFSSTGLLINDSGIINLNSEDDQIAMSRSSISRDSGIVSPSFRPCSGDSMTTTHDSIKNHFTAPTTSHTKSISTNEALVSLTVCKVCYLETHRICLGCSREHYCSEECQRIDWPSHKKQCGRE